MIKFILSISCPFITVKHDALRTIARQNEDKNIFTQINHQKVHYHVAGEGKNIVLLHGWGSQLETFRAIQEHLAENFCVYAIDFPGFGQSDEPTDIWDTHQYTQWLEAFFEQHKIHNPIIFGHSFGGRIAIRLGAQQKAKKLVLIDSAGVKPKRPLAYYLKVYSYKSIKLILKWLSPSLLKKYQGQAGSADYRDASETMKKILIKVVNEDLTPMLSQIKAPSLLIWGENDQDTPLYQAETMESLIPDSGLVVLKNAGHYAHLDKQHEFLRIIDHFIKDDI